MLNESEYSENSIKGSARAEKCKPDWEGMIKRTKERLSHSADFRDAALTYFEGRTAKNKMAELIGELVTECNSLQQEYDRLIESQEKDIE
ncbi:MAG TPA: hypothetical protein VMW10_00430 [Alphaproteobacteria bacterium]|nr:hypothetical protein [Alphaproteobacteria bacterium]